MKLSIITINLNNKLGLIKTLQSIQQQTVQDFQHIVIDGDSTDGGKDIIASNTRINNWISEKDSGVYDAMNKGIKLATGEYLLFLNSGDTLYEAHTIEKIFTDLHLEDVIYGNLLIDDKESPYVYQFPKSLSFKFLFHNFLGHPSTFMKRRLFEDFGPYDLTYKIAADWAFMVKVIAKENVTTKHIEQTIAIFDMDGMSANPKNVPIMLEERKHFLQRTFPLFYEDYLNIQQNEHALERIKSSKGFKILRALGVKKFK